MNVKENNHNQQSMNYAHDRRKKKTFYLEKLK